MMNSVILEILRYKVDEFILKAKDKAEKHILKMIDETSSDFSWAQSESTRPVFDDMCFQYKNQVFSVLIRIFHNGYEITYPERQERFIAEAKKRNMIPCIFPVDFEFAIPDCPPGVPIPIDPKDLPKYQLSPHFARDWTLIHAETGALIDLTVQLTKSIRHQENR